jgi:hypothetical protein
MIRTADVGVGVGIPRITSVGCGVVEAVEVEVGVGEAVTVDVADGVGVDCPPPLVQPVILTTSASMTNGTSRYHSFFIALLPSYGQCYRHKYYTLKYAQLLAIAKDLVTFNRGAESGLRLSTRPSATERHHNPPKARKTCRISNTQSMRRTSASRAW